MPVNDERLRQVLAEQVREVEERVPGYREEMAGTVTRILDRERAHLIHPGKIQQNVDTICRKTGQWLAAKEDEADEVPTSPV